MKIPFWLIILLFIGYSIWATTCWHNHMMRDCCEDTTAAAAAAAETTGVPLFNWNADKPEPDAKFPDWKKAFLASKDHGQGDTLVITGYYRAGEANGEQLARARAEAIRDMLAPELPANRVRIATQMIADDGLAEGSAPKQSASFSWSKMVLKEEDSAIIESDQDVIILFPFNSTVKDRDPKVDAYLKELCAKHKTTNATFNVVGHTDDIGSDEQNMKMGLDRAKSVAQILRSNGIAANRIQTSSKGKTEPVADNATDDGRRQNRRVVITVNR
ncbi:MAG: OmpA family protein [Saprospiraceae bacterium]|nr:OmpA family protein [Saprospiraceae bacterium]